MKFDYVIGNPPYQQEAKGTSLSDDPVYHEFIDACYPIANVVELITPARFLFNAGKTPKSWNKKMLQDKHLKILYYEPNSSHVFSNTSFPGGVAISYHDANKIFGAIENFSPYNELNGVRSKVLKKSNRFLSDMIFLQNKYNIKNVAQDFQNYKEFISGEGKDKRFRNNAFEKVPFFTEHPINDDNILVQGLIRNKRETRFVPRKYIDLSHDNLFSYKVLLPGANGSPAIGERGLTPLIGKTLVAEPNVAYTQTYIGIGSFQTKEEAVSCEKYIKSKFCRAVLGILKVTPPNGKETWKFVPIQDFTDNSDIDWNKSIPEIDQQLYTKYDLSPDEINFIETHVKEMD